MGRNLVRRLLPVASLTLIGTAGLRVLGERAGLYSEGFGVGILVLASLMILSALVLAATRSINREEALRREAEQELRQFNAELERRVIERTAHLDVANKELSAFAYTVSHDLRAPLVTIGGFSQALVEDYLQRLDETGQNYVRRIHAEALRMGHLIDDLLRLSRITRAEMKRETVDLSATAEGILAELHERHPDRQVEVAITKGLTAQGDLRLLRVALENLLVNAWKFTGNRAQARIEFGATDKDGERVFFVRDDGVGFDMAYAHKLFTPFHRMHPAEEFPGTGIGLVTVQRIIGRHGGRIWAEGAVEKGATFYFTL
jgi:light-regulated signal transduction histidine kinase (bacteriophytochrome)